MIIIATWGREIGENFVEDSLASSIMIKMAFSLLISIAWNLLSEYMSQNLLNICIKIFIEVLFIILAILEKLVSISSRLVMDDKAIAYVKS